MLFLFLINSSGSKISFLLLKVIILVGWVALMTSQWSGGMLSEKNRKQELLKQNKWQFLQSLLTEQLMCRGEPHADVVVRSPGQAMDGPPTEVKSRNKESTGNADTSLLLQTRGQMELTDKTRTSEFTPCHTLSVGTHRYGEKSLRLQRLWKKHSGHDYGQRYKKKGQQLVHSTAQEKMRTMAQVGANDCIYSKIILG